MSDRGLRIVWDAAIDRGAWPGPVADRNAVAGEAWLGPVGLLARFETELGLGALHATTSDRAGVLAAQLAGRPGWWRASYDADPLGTCQRLLRDRDLLRMWGWRGEPASERLAALWEATCGAPPGFPDRLAAVIAALQPGRTLDVESIEVRCSVATLAPLWRMLFSHLAACGVPITESTPVPSSASGDLVHARSAGFTPTGDGTLTLLRPHGPLAAADEIAAALAALPTLDGAVVIGPDEVLDAALARHGLPRVGAATRAPASTALVRLVFEAAFEPMDHADLHALLALSPGPVPRRIGSRLVGALSRFPGRRTIHWSAALEEGLGLIDDDRREAMRERIATLVMPAGRRDGQVSTTEIDRRLAALGAWAQSRLSTAPSLAALVGVTGDARSLLARFGAPALSLVQLRRLCDELDRRSGPPSDAHVGLAAVATPGAILAPARVIVWWSFTRESAPATPRVRLSNAERAELRRLGVAPPDPGLLMEGEANRWRRPLDLATEALILVCPLTTESGDENSPHPLWDELCAAMPKPEQARVLAASRLQHPAIAARRTATPRALPAPTLQVSAGTSLPLRERESATSLDKLLGCSLSWALAYHGKLYAGLSDGPSAPSPLLYGNLAHYVLASVFAEGALGAEAAATRAEAILDRELDVLAENLALPRYQIERTSVRVAILASARDLGELLAETGASVRGVELERDGAHGDVALRGIADLVLDAPDLIIDLKWGRSSHWAKLANGSALQLAMYAELFRTPGDAAPMVGFYSLTSQELLVSGDTTFMRARSVGSIPVQATWDGALAMLSERRGQLATGELHAPAANGTEPKSQIVDGKLILAPSCSYCAFDTLCGNARCT